MEPAPDNGETKAELVSKNLSEPLAQQDSGGFLTRPNSFVMMDREDARVEVEENLMAEFRDRELHLVKKALAIAVLTIENREGPLQSTSDQADMKSLLDQIIESDVELAMYLRSARIATTGKPD